jgi:uncharacterized membrane protein required for colicin V production
MTIGTTDIFLLVIIVTFIVVGFFWGALRSAALLVAWLLAFLAGAYAKIELGAYLSREWGQFSPSFNDMAAFGIIYVGILLAAPAVIFVFTRGSQNLTRYQVLDDLLGAFFAFVAAIVGVAGGLIVLATNYGTGTTVVDPAGGPAWTANLYQSLLLSNIGGAINDTVVPILGFVLGPILPEDVREVFG